MTNGLAQCPTAVLPALRRALRLCSLVLCTALTLGVADPAGAANSRYADSTVFVRLKFDGDPGFPNITSFRNTAGLARFSGSAFGLTAAQRNEVVNTIVTRLRERYAAFNVEFVTTDEGPNSHYTWGIDDSAYVFPLSQAQPCANAGNFGRLLGKAIGSRNPTDTACDGSSIHHPRHARTWAGSFALVGQGGVQSQPSLRLGNMLPGNVPVTVAHIANALANNATHEIGHLFGLEHVECRVDDWVCQTTEVMFQGTEAIEATRNKIFNNAHGHITALNQALRSRIRLMQTNRGLLLDPGSGVMLTQNPNLPASVAVPGTPTPLNGQISFNWAGGYAGKLDHLGYDDWRLPQASNPNGSGPCASRLVQGAVILRTCDQSDLGRLFYRLLPWEPNLVSSSLPWTRYWSADSAGNPWVVNRSAREQYPDTTLASAGVWPMRDSVRLVDNGDGTITDTKRGLMWIQDARLWMTHSWAQAGGPMVFAGYSDWRAPRIDELRQDATCETPVRSPMTPTSGCTRSEMAHLFHGWGINSTAPAPFTGLPTPPSDIDFWFATPIPGDLVNGLAYSFRTGVIRAQPRTNRLPVLWVRDFRNGVPAGRRVVADPDPRVTVRFNQVTKAGTLTVSSVTTPLDRFGNRASRTWSFQQGLDYVRGDRALKICVRYESHELPVFLLSIGLWGPTLNGPGRMPLVEGYPDTLNQVVCAWAPYLDSVRVGSFLN